MDNLNSPRCINPNPAEEPDSSLLPITISGSQLIQCINPEEIAEFYKCPVCRDIVTPPIGTCFNGHPICHVCMRHRHQCPECRAQFTGIRNIIAEQILAKCIISCKYAESGCKVILPGDQTKIHKDKCEFRPIFCPDCDKSIDFEKFLDHLESDNVSLLVGEQFTTSFDISNLDVLTGWEPTWIVCYGINFFLTLESDNIDWWFSIACFGTPNEVAQFKCKFVVWNKEKGIQLKHSGPVRSLRVSSYKAALLGECFSLTSSLINAYSRNGYLDIKVKILRKVNSFHLSKIKSAIEVVTTEIGNDSGTSSSPGTLIEPSIPAGCASDPIQSNIEQVSQSREQPFEEEFISVSSGSTPIPSSSINRPQEVSQLGIRESANNWQVRTDPGVIGDRILSRRIEDPVEFESIFDGLFQTYQGVPHQFPGLNDENESRRMRGRGIPQTFSNHENDHPAPSSRNQN